VHSEAEAKRLVVRGAVKALGGSRTTGRRSTTPGAGRQNLQLPSDSQITAPRPAPIPPMPPRTEEHDVRHRQVSVPQDASQTRRQPTPNELSRQRPAFAPKPASSGAADPASATTAPKRRVTKPVMLPAGEEFLKPPPAGLRRGSVTEVDTLPARTVSRLSRGEHGILKLGRRLRNIQWQP
jgi:hypothetical protein